MIPKWINLFRSGKAGEIYGDGETSRDFCYVANVVQANILAACSKEPTAIGEVFNVAVGGKTTLNELYDLIAARIEGISADAREPVYSDFRAGDVRHSQADISKLQRLLGYCETHSIGEGLDITVSWFADR